MEITGNITDIKYNVFLKEELKKININGSSASNFSLENNIICGDCNVVLASLPDDSIDLIITSPPYFQQREYCGKTGIGNEESIDEYIESLLKIFRQCVRVIKKTGTIVFNVGDKYINGNLLLVPYRFAIEAQKESNVKLINEVIWHKINPTPKQVVKKLIPSNEPFFIFAKTNDYHFNKNAFLEYKGKFSNKKKNVGNDIGKKYFGLIDKSDLSNEQKELAKKELNEVIKEVKAGNVDSFRMKIKGLHALPYGGQAGGRLTQIENNGFTIIKIYGNSMRMDFIESCVESIKGNIHPAVFPEFIIQEFIKMLSNENDIVLDPFLGSGTTAVVAKKLNRKYFGIDIHQEYIEYANERINNCDTEIMEMFV